MNFAVIQDHIIEILQKVEGIGRIQAYRKRIHNFEDFKEAFTIKEAPESARINAWIVAFASASNVYAEAPLTGMFRDYEFTVNGFLGLDETSEHRIRQIAERILDIFAENRTLGTLGRQTEPFIQNSSASIASFGIAELAPVLCSTVEIRITCRALRTGIKFK